MNIADRSLALVDLALRRRFAFVNLVPELNDAWSNWCIQKYGFEKGFVDLIRDRVTALNNDIANDKSLGSQYMIGHSYVTPVGGAPVTDPKKWFRNAVHMEIFPLLQEYWFDNPDKAEDAANRLLMGISE